jgi:hypothetical protein
MLRPYLPYHSRNLRFNSVPRFPDPILFTTDYADSSDARTNRPRKEFSPTSASPSTPLGVILSLLAVSQTLSLSNGSLSNPSNG